LARLLLSLLILGLGAVYGSSREIQSYYTSLPPLIDGQASLDEWCYAASTSIPYGDLAVLHDRLYLYLLVDLFGDTYDDIEEDSLSLFFDVNLNGEIDPHQDLVYQVTAEGIRLRYYLEGGQPGPSLSSQAEAGMGFGPSNNLSEDFPKYRLPHRFWELAIPWAELGQDGFQGRISLGLVIISGRPRLSYGRVDDFSSLITISYSSAAGEPLGVIGSLDWLEVTDLARNSQEYQNARPVALLKLPDGNWCTGFLVGPEILWTATHCIQDLSSQELEGVIAVFNWEAGVPPEQREEFLCNKVIASWPDLNSNSQAPAEDRWGVTLLACQPGPIGEEEPESPGGRWGVLRLCGEKAYPREPIYLIHQNDCHGTSSNCGIREYLTDLSADPNKKISFGVISDPQLEPHIFGHDADTLGGSSGAPIFDPETGSVIGYHRGWIRKGEINIATSIKDIQPVLEKLGFWGSLSHC